MNFKRAALCTIVAMLAVVLVYPTDGLRAQSSGIGVEVTPTFGYMFGGKLRGYNGEIDVGDAFSYGVTVSKEVAPGTLAEFSWSGMHAESRLRDFYDFTTDENFDMKVNYYLLGVTQYWQAGSDNIFPYGLMSLGASSHEVSNSVNIANSTEWLFSMGFGLGAKIFLSERIGIRLQGRFLMPVMWGGVNLWCGTGGCGTGVSVTSGMLQGDLTGGLIFKF